MEREICQRLATSEVVAVQQDALSRLPQDHVTDFGSPTNQPRLEASAPPASPKRQLTRPLTRPTRRPAPLLLAQHSHHDPTSCHHGVSSSLLLARLHPSRLGGVGLRTSRIPCAIVTCSALHEELPNPALRCKSRASPVLPLISSGVCATVGKSAPINHSPHALIDVTGPELTVLPLPTHNLKAFRGGRAPLNASTRRRHGHQRPRRRYHSAAPRLR